MVTRPNGEYVGEIVEGTPTRWDGKTFSGALDTILRQVHSGRGKTSARKLHCVLLEARGFDKSEYHSLSEIIHTWDPQN